MKLAPKKSFFMLLFVIYLRLENCFKRIKPIQSKIAATHKILSPTTKIELLWFIGSIIICSQLTEEVNHNMKPLYDLLHDIDKLHWNIELETQFR